jgi:enamine deaminase RidA (YjgF/YER057c/UK114 family)
MSVSGTGLTRQRIAVEHMAWLDGLPACAAMRVGDWVFVSGQVSRDADGSVREGGDPRAQAHRAFAGLQATLEAAGATLADVVDLMSFHLDARDIAAVFDVGREYLTGGFPAWTPVGMLGSWSSGVGLVVRAIACVGEEPKRCLVPDEVAWMRDLPISAGCGRGDLFFASCAATAADGSILAPGDPEGQAISAHEHLARVIGQAGGSWDDVIDLCSFHQDPRGMVGGETAHLRTFAKTPLAEAPAWTAIGTPALQRLGLLVHYRAIADLSAGSRVARTPQGLHWKHQPISGGTRKAGGQLIGIAGEVASDGEGTIIGPGDTASQARYAFDRIAEVMEMHGGSITDVVEVTSFHKDPRASQIVLDTARDYFPSGAEPAWTPVGTTGLWNPGYLHEIYALGVLDTEH